MEGNKSYFEDLNDFVVGGDDNENNMEEEVDLDEIDFSDASGGFKKSLKRATKKAVKRKKKKIPMTKVIAPRGSDVIVEGMDKMLLGGGADVESIRNMGYYKGKRLKELVLTINNEGLIDFDIELFNPSAPHEYLISTSQNLNDKVLVAGGIGASYTDVLFNLLANPALIANMRVVISGPSDVSQRPQPILVTNKSIDGTMTVNPCNLNLHIDSMQVDPNIVYFDIFRGLGRAYVPDGMDIMKYKVLAGNTVSFAFFYKQHQIKKFFFPETRSNKIL